MKEFWNERYRNTQYVYGKKPNVFFAQQLEKLAPGTLILPCEGEGRNAVYAAKQGWKTNAFDYSQEAKAKALQLANNMQVDIRFDVIDVNDAEYPNNSADVVAFIYTHFPENTRTRIHQKAIKWLKPGGKIILEAFTPLQLNNSSGGPKDASMLYTTDMMKNDFKTMDIELLVETQTELSEGEFHEGNADILRMVAVKK